MRLGTELALCRLDDEAGWKRRCDEIARLLERMDPLPDLDRSVLETPEPHPAAMLKALWTAMSEARKELGVDLPSLPLLAVSSVVLHRVIDTCTSEEVSIKNSDLMLHTSLQELDIDASIDEVKRFIDAEAARITGEDLRNEIEATADRISEEILATWDEATRRSPMELPTRLWEPRGHDRPSCFLSYQTADEPFCNELHRQLVARGVGVWYAPHSRIPGRHLAEQLEAPIGDSDLFLLVLSRSSYDRPWIQFEIATARKAGRPIIPIRLVPADRSYFWSFLREDSVAAKELREAEMVDLSGWREPQVMRTGIELILKRLAEARSERDQ